MTNENRDALLLQLEKEGHLFSGYQFHKNEENLHLLGAGGFSAVYEVWSQEQEERAYALKVDGFEKHSVTLERFLETTYFQKALAEGCPYVVRIIATKALRVKTDFEGNLLEAYPANGENWEESDKLLQFVLMEKLEDVIQKDKFGQARLCQDSLKSVEEVLDFALQIGEAIREAHKMNALHRDIKLENTFYDAGEDIYKLGDFGIARLVEKGDAETIVFTEGYGAPEIETQQGKHYNATADIYSFGIVLYLLLNDMKFPGTNGYYADKCQYEKDFVFPAPKRSFPELTQMIRKMCAYNPKERYQSMDEVMTHLIRLQQEDALGRQKVNAEELPNIGTQTFQNTEIEEPLEGEETLQLSQSAVERKKRRKEKEAAQSTDPILVLLLGGILFWLIKSFVPESELAREVALWLFAFGTYMEGKLLRMKELHILGWIATVGVGCYSVYTLGFSLPQGLLFLALLLGKPIILQSTGLAIMVWLGFMIWG